MNVNDDRLTVQKACRRISTCLLTSTRSAYSFSSCHIWWQRSQVCLLSSCFMTKSLIATSQHGSNPHSTSHLPSGTRCPLGRIRMSPGCHSDLATAGRLEVSAGYCRSRFAPGCAFYLSCWYRRWELATRYAILYTSVPIAGGLSGLLAGVITQYMDGAGGVAGWRWLFVSVTRRLHLRHALTPLLLQILEGLASIVAAVIIFFLMPDFPSNSTKFLGEDTLMACQRLAVDGIGMAQSSSAEQISHWDAFKMTVRDWRVWAQCLMFTLVTGSQTMQYFIPTLVKSFGWSGYDGQCKMLCFACPSKDTSTNALAQITPSHLMQQLWSMSSSAAGSPTSTRPNGPSFAVFQVLAVSSSSLSLARQTRSPNTS